MKSNNNNIGSEEVVELIPPRAIPHIQMGRDRESFIMAEVTSVLADTTEAASIQNISGIGDTLTSTDGLLHSTTHESNDLPEIARNLSWYDTFYESSKDKNDIIMAFDLDRKKYDQCLFPLARFLITVGVILLVTVLSIIGSADEDFSPMFAIIFCAFPAFIFVWICDCNQRSNQFRVERAHIALTHDGIYIDEVDSPSGHDLMMREVIMYKQIQSCKVKREGSYRDAIYNVEVIFNHGAKHLVRDIRQPQLFVDIVNAMVKKHTYLTTDLENPKIS